MFGKDVKAAKDYNSERGNLAGVQKLLGKTAVLLTNIGKVAESAMCKIEGIGQRIDKTSIDKSLKDIKSVRISEKSSKLERDTAR